MSKAIYYDYNTCGSTIEQCLNCPRKTCKYDHSYNRITKEESPSRLKKLILKKKNKKIYEFSSYNEAQIYLTAFEGLDIKSYDSFYTKVNRAIKDNTELYGFKWDAKFESNDSPIKSASLVAKYIEQPGKKEPKLVKMFGKKIIFPDADFASKILAKVCKINREKTKGRILDAVKYGEQFKGYEWFITYKSNR